ncbi:MAG TPA: hypothetical protein VHE81_12175, partial [Lacipirellulaceae bacterium]|nr:hypothetical protein [Lacipirellulaceae bacterium]
PSIEAHESRIMGYRNGVPKALRYRRAALDRPPDRQAYYEHCDDCYRNGLIVQTNSLGVFESCIDCFMVGLCRK